MNIDIAELKRLRGLQSAQASQEDWLAAREAYMVALYNAAPARIEAAERAEKLEMQVRDMEEAEASVCPEDVGVDEYVPVLNKRIERLEAALREIHRVAIAIRLDDISPLPRWRRQSDT